MKSDKIVLVITIALSIIHNYLFWDEYIGVNMLIFSFLLASCLLYKMKDKPKSMNFWFIFSGSLITGILVVVLNTIMSKIIHVLSFIILIGFSHFPTIKSLLFACATSLEGIFSFPGQMQALWKGYEKNSSWIMQFGRWIRLIFIPLLVLVVFYVVFLFANSRFNDLSKSLWTFLFDYLFEFLNDISFARIFMWVLAFYLIGAALFKNTLQRYYFWDKAKKDQLERRKIKIQFKNPLSLRSEYTSAVLMVGMVNALLLLVNIIDIQWIWFGFDTSTVKNLSQFVHEGTYLLIGSILLSMGIIMYFFRANLNFLKQNAWLKNLTFLWVFQNIILCISVALRNYWYIESFGLAYKRIGVIIFLVITILGLISLVIKVNKRLSTYYLWRINAWSVYLVMIICCFFNWDILIARYNLEVHKKNLDLEFLLSLSNKTLPLVLKHSEFFRHNSTVGFYSNHTDSEEFERKIKLKTKELKFLIEECSWKSWNYADYNAYREVKSFEDEKK